MRWRAFETDDFKIDSAVLVLLTLQSHILQIDLRHATVVFHPSGHHDFGEAFFRVRWVSFFEGDGGGLLSGLAGDCDHGRVHDQLLFVGYPQ